MSDRLQQVERDIQLLKEEKARLEKEQEYKPKFGDILKHSKGNKHYVVRDWQHGNRFIAVNKHGIWKNGRYRTLAEYVKDGTYKLVGNLFEEDK